MITPKVITAPIIEPVTEAEAKLHCKVDGTSEDTLFTLYIAAARAFLEDQAGWTIYETTYEITLDRWPGCDYIDLPRATPLLSVTSVKWYDEDQVVTTLVQDTDYLLDTYSTPGRIYLPNGESWPSGTLRRRNGIVIRYVAGSATSPLTEAAAAIKLPILLLVAGMYENRESETVTDKATIEALSFRYGAEAFISRLREKTGSTSY